MDIEAIKDTATKLMAKRCDMCPMCKWARANPDHTISKAIQFHGKFCPFWQSWQKVHGQDQA